MGYSNRTFRAIVISPRGRKAAKQIVNRLRRRAEQRELRGEHERQATHARRRGWWFD